MLLDYLPLEFAESALPVMACCEVSDSDACSIGESASDGINEYNIRNIIRVSADFHNLGGTQVDPSEVTLFFKTPDGIISEITYPGSIIRDSAGLYHFDVLIMQSGNHYYEYEGRGNLIATAEGQFLAKPSMFPE